MDKAEKDLGTSKKFVKKLYKLSLETVQPEKEIEQINQKKRHKQP